MHMPELLCTIRDRRGLDISNKDSHCSTVAARRTQVCHVHAQVFLSHLHSDHIADLVSLYALASNRTRPLTVYGPSGSTPELGTSAAIAALRQVNCC